jgi:hypothetical protein
MEIRAVNFFRARNICPRVFLRSGKGGLAMRNILLNDPKPATGRRDLAGTFLLSNE